MATNRLVLSLAAVVLLPALMLTGCGGKKKSDPTATTQPTQASSNAQATRPAGTSATQPSVVSSPSVSITTTAGGASSSSIEACRAVTKDEATTAVGETVRDPEGINVGQQNIGPGVSALITSCTFSATSGSSLDVAIWRVTGAQGAQLRPLMETLLCAQKERITGLGDVACWDSSEHTTILILKGTAVINIDLTGGAPNPASRLQTLASRVAGRVQ